MENMNNYKIDSKIDNLLKKLEISEIALYSIKDKLNKLVVYDHVKNDNIEYSPCQEKDNPTIVDKMEHLINKHMELNDFLEEILAHLSLIL